MPLDFNELRQLVITIAQTDIAELTLKSDDFELTVRKAVGVSNQLLPSVGSILNSVVTGSTSTSPAERQLADKTVPTPVQLSVATSGPLEQKLIDVISPMVGTFYRSSAPGEPPFVEVGERIRASQPVCIIEAMKLMNEIEAEVSGQVMEILVQNGEPVEYGQPLMRINPG